MNLVMPVARGLYYFPTVRWLAKAVISGAAVINSTERHTKQSHWNRLEIPGGEGKIRLSIPLLGGRQVRCSYEELLISKEYAWQEQHWKTIESCYNRSPWFEYYKDSLRELYQMKVDGLWDWNILCLDWLLKKTGLQETILWVNEKEASEKERQSDSKLENQIDSITYRQVFQDKIGFLEDVSSLDLLFCEGKNVRFLLFNKS